MVTELRVHGVTGTLAQEMLDRPLLRRVAGDGEAAFFRPQPEYGATTGAGGVDLEAYRWGNLTAGAAARALWLLLLPFMLANVAFWLRPKTGKFAKTWIRALSRIFALTVTATFVLAFAGMAIDLVGWQCGSSARCLSDRPYLTPLADGFFATTSRRLALAALIPLIAIGVLWFLGRRSWTRYEAYPTGVEDGDGDGLAHACFWNGKPLVGRLRAIHVAVAFTTVDAVLLGVLVPHDGHPVGWVLAGVAALVLAVSVMAVCLRGMTHRDRPAGWAEPLSRGLRFVALALTGFTLLYALLARDRWPAGGGLPNFGGTITVLFAVQTLLLLLLAAVIGGSGARGTFLAGLAAPMVLSMALGVAVAFAAGASYRIADFLDRAADPSTADYAGAAVLRPPPSFEWAALGFVLLLVVVVIVAVVARLSLERRLVRRARPMTDTDFPGGRHMDGARATRIDGVVANAMLTDHGGRLVAWVYAPTAVAAVAVTVLALLGYRPVELAPSGSAWAEALSFTVNLGTYLIGLAVLALLVIGVLAYRYERLRRIVGVLWDLGTFWPRAGHPLAPPCYAERVVPELVTRATWLAERGGVILSGHSQGSVLAAATVLQLPPRVRAQAALLTYGSPLRRLYARFFPSYVDDAVLAQVASAVSDPGQHTPRWVNLWRSTDPIGGRVDAPARDVRLVDPPTFGFAPGDTVFAEIDGHSNYQRHPAFGDAVNAVRPHPVSAGPVTPTPASGRT